MQKVITVNLNGNAYQVDEPGFDALRAYLDGAERGLVNDPDRAEIVADLEQAIADKCARFLGAHKTVVTHPEVAQILAEMGPVEGAEPAEAPYAHASAAGARESARTADASADPRTSSHKRLYAIYDGAWIGGVCNGLAAYFDVDPTIVRVAFVALTFLTGGLWIVVYVALMFMLPEATTPEEHAAAHGLPFNAQELVRRVKAKYAEFAEKEGWKREWKKQRRLWKAQRREWRAGYPGRSAWRPDAPPPSYSTQVFAGAMIPVLVVLNVALLAAFAVAAISLLLTGRILTWSLPPDLPLWAAVLILILVYQLFAWPLHGARRASRYASGHAFHGQSPGESVVGLVFGVFVFWMLYKHVPLVHDFVQDFQSAFHTIWQNLRESLR
jgi:phage shock protein PspC (stress-responsive transcriptional regulator)